MEDLTEKKGLLGWFATNHVAANILMFLVIAAGLLTITTAKMEIFPEFSLDMISISVPYRGASPADVEEGVCRRVEEAIAAVEGIKRITSTAGEGMGSTVIEVEECDWCTICEAVCPTGAILCPFEIVIEENR